MKFILVQLFYFTICFAFSQNEHSGILLDAETIEPLEFVSVFNTKDYTVSNSDGRFEFSSAKDSVTFYRVGYDKLVSSFGKLKDTIFLEKSVLELNEVVVTNAKTTYQKLRDSIQNNLNFSPFKEKFLIRTIAKKDNEIWRIQDIQGKLLRKTLFYKRGMEATKKDYVVELTNMRKVGAVTDENNAYLRFPSFNQIFRGQISLGLEESAFDFKESYFEDGKKIRLEFNSNPNEEVKNISGYYILDAESYAIEHYYEKSVPKNPPYKKNKFLRYRDIYYEQSVFFKKHTQENRYYISSAKTIGRVETTDEEKSFNLIYEENITMTTSNNFSDFKVKKNISASKDIFKLNYSYNPSYWNSQNQLLLTEEMEQFIKKMGEDNNEFKVRNNMN